MLKNIYLIFVFLFISLVILTTNDFYFMGQMYFYTLVSYTILSVVIGKKVELIDIWNVAFVFVILSEVLLLKSIDEYKLAAIKYLLIANNLTNIGYLTTWVQKKKRPKNFFTVKIRDSKIITPIILGSIILYVSLKLQDALISFTLGRSAVDYDGNLLSPIVNSLGIILPSIIAYYYTYIRNKKLWFPILYSLPVFVILFMGGTRFPLLFSLLGFFIVIQTKYFKKPSLKQYSIGVVLLLGLSLMSTLMKDFRSNDTRNTENVIVKNEVNNIPELIATNFMSAEGVVDMTSLMFKHFEVNSHLYGSSSSFILYFWVPRNIWSEKPTMLGYWFIREYRSGFGEGHSASFGFTGDLYADFGLFSLFFVFLIGRGLKYAENFKNSVLKIGGYDAIIAAMLFPYTFFFVRSPITATMTFLGMLLVYYIFKRLIFTK